MKKVLILTASFLLTQMYLFAQTAPNFTVTDADGNVHRLYEDYLDQGKTVVLDLFFTDCPPCNTKAPLIQQLYVDWGAGAQDLMVMALSTRSWDSDQKILDFDNRHGITFPSAGNDGGSVPATDFYTNSPDFFGTPWFIVISPTSKGRTFEYVYNTSQLIPNLEAAIERTGAVKTITPPPPPQATEIAGRIITWRGRPIPDVKVYEASDPDNFSMTSASGQFAFDMVLDNFSTYELVVEKDDSFNEGLSTIDLITISKQVRNIQLLSSFYERMAADMNGSGSISTLDLVDCRKLILFVSDKLAAYPSPWRFFAPGVNGANPASQVFFNSQSNTASLNLIGIKMGDMNDSVNLD